MSKPSAMVRMAQEMCRKLVAEQTRTRLALGFDAAILAAHEVFGMGPGRASAFANAYHEAMEQLAGLYPDDAKENLDDRIDYAKGTRDALIRKIVGEENFVPFDRFYSAGVYIDELKRVRTLQARNAEEPPVRGTDGSPRNERMAEPNK